MEQPVVSREVIEALHASKIVVTPQNIQAVDQRERNLKET